MIRMTIPALALLLSAQTFSPQLPAPIPAVQSPVAEAFTLRWSDMYTGTGTPALAGQKYTVHYTGWLRDGTQFDSSRDRNVPLQFVQGRRQVISGWEAGFEGMKVGGRRRLFIPHQMAYGDKGSGKVIPPKAELIFDVELLGVEDVPETPAAADLLLAWNDTETKLMALMKAIPEDKYDWRPAPGVRSIQEVLIHAAAGSRLMLGIADKSLVGDAIPARHKVNLELEKQPLPKDKVLELLTDCFGQVRKTLTPMRAGTLASETTFFGTATTRRGVYTAMTAHLAEHLGQLIAYSRLNGITPPWSTGE
jgi:hypothetical protein